MELTRFFFAVILLLLFSHTFGFLLNKLKLPRVIGEIFGGLLLGPTALGYFSPNAYTCYSPLLNRKEKRSSRAQAWYCQRRDGQRPGIDLHAGRPRGASYGKPAREISASN